MAAPSTQVEFAAAENSFMLFVYLLALVPISLLLAYLGAPPIWVFGTAALAIVPLAEWLRRATEQLAARVGSAIGGLLNITFGNMAELILAIVVLFSGNTEVVKATITGSIIGNGLLGLGVAILVGSWRRSKQTFQSERAGLLSSLLVLSVIALLLPAIFDLTERGVFATAQPQLPDERFSLGAAVVLIVAYVANLVYTLITHRSSFATEEPATEAEWSLAKALLVLVGATAVVALEAELVSDALEATAGALSLSPFFMGVIVLPLIGNATEYVTAVYFARQDQMDLVVGVTVGATIQMALFTAPLLVLLSYVLGHPMDLVFSNPLELAGIVGVTVAINTITRDGETTWFEGVLLLSVYALLALAFFFVTP
jgi:Ca2+:H+ antiporter